MSKPRGSLHRVLLSAAAFVLGAAVTSAQAQMKADDLRFRATIYGWFPGISGTTEFPSGAGGPSFNVNAKDVIEDLKMAFMGTFEVQSGKWGALVDWVYADIGGDKSGTRNFSIRGQTLAAGVTANLSLDTKTNILTLAGTYSLIEEPATSVRLVFGARMLDIGRHAELGLQRHRPGGHRRGGHGARSARPTGTRSSGWAVGRASATVCAGSCPTMPMSAAASRSSPGRRSSASDTRSAGATSASSGAISITSSSPASPPSH